MEMIFKKSRRFQLGALLAGLVLGILATLYMYNIREASLSRSLLPFPIVLAAAFFIGKYVSRLISVREYQMVMGLLYADLQPTKFIAAVEPLAKASKDPVTKTTTLAHLANGYAAVGRFEDAHEILEHTQLPEEAAALRGLLLNNLVSCLLLEGKQQEAKQCQAKLRALLEDEQCKEDFRQKVQNALAYHDICLNIYKARASDIAALEQDFESSRNALHKLEVKLYLAIAYQRKGDKARFLEAQKYVMETSGTELYYGKLARELGDHSLPENGPSDAG